MNVQDASLPLLLVHQAENNTVREKRHWIPHDDIWNQKCFTGSTESGPDMFPTWNCTKWSSRYTTCSILVFQHTLDKFFCRIIQIYSKTLKPEENNKKQKITTETCDGRHICSCYNCEVLGKRQNKTYVGRVSVTFVCSNPSNERSTDPAIHRTSQTTIYRTFHT